MMNDGDGAAALLAADDDVEYPSYDCGGEWRLKT